MELDAICKTLSNTKTVETTFKNLKYQESILKLSQKTKGAIYILV